MCQSCPAARLPVPPREWKADSTFERTAGINSGSMLIVCSSHERVTIAPCPNPPTLPPPLRKSQGEKARHCNANIGKRRWDEIPWRVRPSSILGCIIRIRPRLVGLMLFQPAPAARRHRLWQLCSSLVCCDNECCSRRSLLGRRPLRQMAAEDVLTHPAD